MYKILIASNREADISLIRQRLDNREFICEIQIAENAQQAYSIMTSSLPDFALIDPRLFNIAVQSKNFSRRHTLPVIIMGYSSECAIVAFDHQAFDFVMQPLNPARLDTAIDRVTGAINKRLKNENRSLKVSNSQLATHVTQLSSKKLIIRETGRIRLLEQNNIRYVKGAGNYVEIFLANGKKIMHRGTLRSIENELDPGLFCRIHKSTLIKMSLVEELKPTPKGDYRIKLQSGEDLTLSRNNKDKLKLLLHSS